jgi:hypothetical protein
VGLRNAVRFVEEYVAIILKWVTYITSLTVLFGYIATFFEWGNKGPFLYIKNNLQSIWLGAITAVTLLLIIWTSLLRRRFISSFRDNFKNNLQTNWDFQGKWRIPEKGTLLVTGPDDCGGITKIGAQWENYTFTFKARITRDCIGVIVRAQDLDNYYMFQIRADKIVSHRRVAVPVVPVPVPQPPQQAPQTGAPQMQPITFNIGWVIYTPPMQLNRPLNDWFDCKITVRGESVCVRIDDNIVLQSESLLKIPTGKVGFRNAGIEEALIKNVKVVLQP